MWKATRSGPVLDPEIDPGHQVNRIAEAKPPLLALTSLPFTHQCVYPARTIQRGNAGRENEIGNGDWTGGGPVKSISTPPSADIAR